PSAQVKSSILLAGLYAEGETTVREIIPARDHTERMLASLGARIKVEDGKIKLVTSALKARDIKVPGDISSAAFLIAAAAAMPGSHLVIENVGLNPTRTGIIDVLKRMGASIETDNLGKWAEEDVGDLVVRGRRLHGITITRELVPRVLDEIPVLAVIAATAEGSTTITGAEELRVKESDRISAVVTELTKLGIGMRELPDGMVIAGTNRIDGGVFLESYGDNRIAMALAIAGL
ncbi:MAG TPA: 3-phosphoshikimate 1-carboxyvinyltransferase, partial [Firmicutes bacterium]|nr:3-phosphoshikimate 1-carboxyvinyltransferase [Bacillota bacterium]